ncbi:hypothetical protein [Paenibacillus cremeus]|uniref:Uncharacterized protein n=1 Tax=Paenibacillus cremeus TaxID=2163881 RepID=A0A559JFD2_9BACL|nr:hypothetical protein [Paenibacillus cremeus]TVX98575.1 hypothetical protein FPZ49_34445 [Paenibacillus cremeus]
MILYPPIKFDENEWFIIVSLILVLIPSLLLPNRFSPLTVIFMMLFNVFLGQTTDYILAVPPYDLYDVNDRPDYEIFDFILYFLLYPPAAYLVIYLYSKWTIKGLYIIPYIVGSAALSVGLESVAHIFHVFTYKGWKLIYSFAVYHAVWSLNILMLHFVQSFIKKYSIKYK